MRNPVTRYATFGSMFRFFGMFACDYYLPSFFLGNYPSFNKQFGILIALITGFGGIFSSVLGGILADKLSPKDDKAFARICKWGSLLAWPFFTASVLL